MDGLIAHTGRKLKQKLVDCERTPITNFTCQKTWTSWTPWTTTLSAHPTHDDCVAYNASQLSRVCRQGSRAEDTTPSAACTKKKRRGRIYQCVAQIIPPGSSVVVMSPVRGGCVRSVSAPPPLAVVAVPGSSARAPPVQTTSR